MIIEDGELLASNDVLEIVEPGALMFPEEELISRMRSKPDLALDSSSTGGRIRSKKQRSDVGPSESMDPSGSSLDLTAEVENLSREVVDLAPSSAEVGEFHPVGPLSSIGLDEVANWRAKYHLSDDVVIRIPGPIDRVSDFEVDEVPKAAPKKAAPSENDDEVQFIRSNKRQAATALASSYKKKSRSLGSTPRVFPTSSNDPATFLANLNTKVFPLTPAMSQQFHLGERMDEHASLKADLAELTSQLREEKNNVLAKEKEIKALKLKVCNQDEARALAAAENMSLREQLEQREEEVCNLRGATEIFDAAKNMAVNGTIVVACWELMKEWLNHQTDSWDLEGALEQYKIVKTSEAEFQGLLAPTFEGEPSLPRATEIEKTPEPVADDPPASGSLYELFNPLEMPSARV
ncbi:hypothetical protein HID58_034148 [Brassica napus]|uniref:Uncharacterized protein n=1 Tax=Brassica napus TaxID=3708 RepID=A0ABQ8C195_BRANA|nr:hypothetical protein HID58_034148 [Brassica napus]